jgi:quinol-cytochrome oxidoreductase complex cytochrome b subunit
MSIKNKNIINRCLGFMGQVLQNHLVNYPTPSNLNYMYGFGSLLGIYLGLQIITGIYLAGYYTPHVTYAFHSVEHIMRDVPGGWLIRYMHANGASMIFILMYTHMARGFYYRSYQAPRQSVWYSGVILFILMAGTAFLGYVLPWGQMSFWGATVITNIVSSIPVIGETIVIWIWGGFSVSNITLIRFFSLHFALPFIIAGLSIWHLVLLHRVGSSNPTGLELDFDYVRFYPYYFLKDVHGFVIFSMFFFVVVIWFPNLFGHPDNYIPANYVKTPTHIVPEWYFLPFYSMLKAVPSKLGGAICMVGAMAILLLMPALDFSPLPGNWRFGHDIIFTLFLIDMLLLGWLGGKAPNPIYVLLNQILTALYFSYFLVILPVMSWFETIFVETVKGGE